MRDLLGAAKRGVQRALGRVGYRLAAVEPDFCMPRALDRAARRVPTIGTIIDVGASNGQWTEKALARWPGARALLVEGNACHAGALEEYARRDPRVEVALVAATDRVGSVFFDISDPYGGSASSDARTGRVEVAASTIDALVEERGLPGPYLLKLDTHGHEAPILEGARRTLADTSLAIVEVYNFKLSPECLRFHELCALLEARGLRPIDLCDPMLRPADQALWQLDLVFARADHPTFESVTYDAGRA